MKPIWILIAAASGCWAQPAPDCRPAPSNVAGAPYPCIHSDLRVTFRVPAPAAQSVRLSANNSDSGMGKVPVDLTGDSAGVWNITVGPLVPGFHYYWYVIDGVEVPDPASES